MKSSFVVCINLNANHNQISIQLLWKTSPKDYITLREPVNFSVEMCNQIANSLVKTVNFIQFTKNINASIFHNNPPIKIACTLDKKHEIQISIYIYIACEN